MGQFTDWWFIRPHPFCHPDCSGGISTSWQQYLRLAGDYGVGCNAAGDPSASLRMTGRGAIPPAPIVPFRPHPFFHLYRQILSSRPQWRDLNQLAAVSVTWWGLRGWVQCGGRSFDFAQDDRVWSVIPAAPTLSFLPHPLCHPDRSGGISTSWQRYL